MDNEMIALKSSDDIIYSPDTKSTVLPRQAIYGQGKAVLNAMIMSKPGSPFLLRWMEKYRNSTLRNGIELRVLSLQRCGTLGSQAYFAARPHLGVSAASK